MSNSTNDLRNRRRGGFYWHNNEPYVSVTTVLKVIDKPALRWWFGREVYYAMVKDPSMDEKKALAAPYRKSKKAMLRGTTVHKMVEDYEHGDDPVSLIGGEFEGYAKAFKKWLNDNTVTIVENEKSVRSDIHKYAGTLDLIVKLDSDEALHIIDIKTGKDIYDDYFLQLAAYQHALAEQGWDIKHTAILLLNPDGTYKFELNEASVEPFLAAKKLWEWKNRELIEKVGYQGAQWLNQS